MSKKVLRYPSMRQDIEKDRVGSINLLISCLPGMSKSESVELRNGNNSIPRFAFCNHPSKFPKFFTAIVPFPLCLQLLDLLTCLTDRLSPFRGAIIVEISIGPSDAAVEAFPRKSELHATNNIASILWSDNNSSFVSRALLTLPCLKR